MIRFIKGGKMILKRKNILNFLETNFRKFIISVIVMPAFVLAPVISFAESINGTIEFEGRTRDYILFLPMNYESQDSLPLVMNLHGSYTGFNGYWQLNYTGMNEVADTSGFMVLYPSGILEDGSAGGWFTDVDDPVNGVGFIDALLDTISDLYKVNSDQIYSCGTSAGGSMSCKLASELPDRIAAIASNAGSISGGVMNNVDLKRPMPFLCINGTEDSYLGAELTVEFWKELNICSEPDTLIIPDTNLEDNSTVEKITCANQGTGCEVILYRVINGGHTWPGATYDIPSVGNTNRDINANVEIWNFFKQYKLSGLSFLDRDITPRSVMDDLETLPRFINLKPEVLMQNGGLNDIASIPAAFQIDSSGAIIHEDDKVFDELKSMEKKELMFDKTHTLIADHYELICTSLLADDENVKNDTLKLKIRVTDMIDDFESGETKQWISDYGWGIRRSASRAHSGNYVLYSKKDKSYKDSDTTSITFFSSFNLSSLETAYISFYTNYGFNEGDAGYVEVSPDNGQTWEQIGNAFTGNQDENELTEIPLESYVQQGITELMLRFKVINNPDNDFPKWYIDDVMIHPNENSGIAVNDGGSSAGAGCFVLRENYPNPFNPSTTISYKLDKSSHVCLKIFDILGQEITTLVNEHQTGGDYSVKFDASGYAGGIYFYQLRTGDDITLTRKMTLVK